MTIAGLGLRLCATTISCLHALVVLTTVFVTNSFTEESEVQQPQSENSIEGEIQSRDEVAYDPTKRSLFPTGYYEYRDILWDWQRKHGLELTFSYDIVGQRYRDDEDSFGGLAGDASLSGRWLLFGAKHDRPIYLTFRVRSRNALTANPPSAISSEAGLYWKTVDGFNDSGIQIPSLYFSQELGKREVILRYGQFSIDHFFDNHRFRGAKKFFLNQSFSSNPAVNFPSFGAGAILQWNKGERWELIGGVSNIQGTEQDKEVDFELTSTALFESIQGRYQFSGFAGHKAELRVMGWRSDSIEEKAVPEGRGISLTIGHDGFSPGEGFAFRYAYSDGETTNTDQIVFAGYGKDVHSHDHMGVGISGGRSSATGNWQVVLESYYRWRVSKELMITPDLQIIAGEDIGSSSNVCLVAGLRVGIVF